MACGTQARRTGGADAAPPWPEGESVDPRDKKIAELERETRRLQARLERAEGLIAVQKKVAQLLGIPLTNDENT
jgi:hypothetical protein